MSQNNRVGADWLILLNHTVLLGPFHQVLFDVIEYIIGSENVVLYLFQFIYSKAMLDKNLFAYK